MSDIHEYATVLCPFDRVPSAAEAFVATLPSKDGIPIVPIRITIGDLVVERQADLMLKAVRAYPGFEIMEIRFRPHDGGPYPTFRGTLSVEDVGSNYARLDLDGSYDPPMGIAGAVFDAVAGHRIAVAACRELLERLKAGIEDCHKARSIA